MDFATFNEATNRNNGEICISLSFHDDKLNELKTSNSGSIVEKSKVPTLDLRGRMKNHKNGIETKRL